MACVHRRPFKDEGWGRHETTGPVVRKLSCMSKTLPIKRRRRQIQEEQQLERARVGGPLPKTQVDSSRKTNPYLFFPSL